MDEILFIRLTDNSKITVHDKKMTTNKIIHST